MPHPTGGIGQHYSMEADEYFAEHDPQGKIGNARRIVQDAGHLIGGTGRLLDVGVGRGETILAAKELGWETEGVEPSATFADYAEKMTGAKIWRIAVENADIPAGSFDVVILAAVLEHLYDPDRVIAKASSVLRSGGVLYVDVPNEHGLYFKAGNLYQKFRRRDWCVNLAPTFSPYHVFGFGVGSIHRLLKKHSLKPVRCEVVGGTSMVSGRGGLAGSLERIAARAVTKLSEFGRMGTYIETWAVKK
jgi:SAM-dependent methyltransferase